MSLTIPEAILTYHRDMLFSSWQTLERQQKQVTDPEVYQRLDQINNILFSAWLTFRDPSENRCILTTIEQAVVEGKNEL